jgi:predicted ATPase
MAQSTLKEINDAVFNFLMERHYQAKEQGKPDSFLFVMATDESRLKQGFWLPGDDESVIISFLTRGGREAALYIHINSNRQTSIRFHKASGLLIGDTDYAAIGKRLNLPNANQDYLSRTYSSADYLSNLVHYITTDGGTADEFIVAYSQNRSDFFELGNRIELKQFYEQFQRVQQWRMAIKPTYNWSKKPMPYALQWLYVRNFRGIKILLLEPLPVDTKWIFVTGKNGFGKSSLLQAIALSLWGVRDESNREWADASATVQSTFNATKDGLFYNDIDYQRYTFSYGRIIHGHLATYGSSRLQINPTATRLEPDSGGQFATLYHLFNNDGSLLSVDQWLIDLQGYDKPQFKQLVNLLKALIPALHSVEVLYDPARKIPQAIFYEKDETDDGKKGHHYEQGVPFKQLASGFQNIIALVADMVRRLSLTNLSAQDYKNLTGIVIIDELELHLHPKLQRELPKTLSELFPNVQFIASTHSPIPLLGAPNESIVLTVDRTEETGVTVERLDVDFSKLLPNAILTSPIFGFEDIIPESAPSIAEVQMEDSYDEALATERLKKKLKILKAKLNDD